MEWSHSLQWRWSLLYALTFVMPYVVNSIKRHAVLSGMSCKTRLYPTCSSTWLHNAYITTRPSIYSSIKKKNSTRFPDRCNSKSFSGENKKNIVTSQWAFRYLLGVPRWQGLCRTGTSSLICLNSSMAWVYFSNYWPLVMLTTRPMIYRPSKQTPDA